MTRDQQWLLEQLARWQTGTASEPESDIRAAVRSPEHQRLAARVQEATRTTPGSPFDWQIAPPC